MLTWDLIKPGMAGRERGMKNKEQGMSLCYSQHKLGNTVFIMKILVTITSFELCGSQLVSAAKAGQKVHTSVMLLATYWLTAAHWSLHWCFQLKIHPVHIRFTPMARDKQLHVLHTSYCSLSPHPYELHGSQKWPELPRKHSNEYGW